MISFIYSLLTCQYTPKDYKPVDPKEYFPKDNPLPEDIYGNVFSYLTGPEIKNCSLVNKKWHHMANHESFRNVWVNKYAFGAKEWKQYLGDTGDNSPLPKDILSILRKPCPFFEGKRIGETHVLVWIPKTVNNNPCNLINFGQLIKAKYFPETDDGYDLSSRPFMDEELGKKSLDESRWVLFVKRCIPNSKALRDKEVFDNYAERKTVVDKYAKESKLDYTMPEVLTGTVCVIANYVKSMGKLVLLFSTRELRTREEKAIGTEYTMCLEKWNNNELFVGGFEKTGLIVGTGMAIEDNYCTGVTPQLVIK